MRVSDVMTRRVIFVTPKTTIVDAIRLMLKNHISGLPVIDHKSKLVGMVTEGDFLRRAEIGTEHKRSAWFAALFGPAESASRYVHSHGLKVKDVMTGNPAAAREGMSLDEVVHLMETRGVKRLPVVRRGKVIGIVSRANLMRALASIHRAPPRASERDATIRNRILSSIAKQSWSTGAVFDVIVRNGIADMWGTIADVKQREAFKVLVENTPGVKRAEDHLTWRETPHL
jgi:CBS domain-containing protein